MDSKSKGLLLYHKPFLVKNIVWSPQLGSMLKAQNLITESMLLDIEREIASSSHGLGYRETPAATQQDSLGAWLLLGEV
ncbi:hypothetical protein ElyMa_002249900 [Elysia marginata]|uniref:Uncharacterized protein n=1 Tax=Elysia marginata TaxID=1093978 RepID=A0AAV4FWX5_9GAST|nr:hypothetical protein ElyMa_002249900 [Elysia marginata]